MTATIEMAQRGATIMTERFRRFVGAVGAALAALALVVAPAGAQDTAAQADAPPLWTVDGGKGRIFLFGSFHLLPAGVKWRTPAVENALIEARVVVIETDLSAAEDPQAMQALIARYGLLPQGQTLQSVLPAKVHADFERAASELGLPAATLAPLRPWLAAVTVAVQSFAKQGFDPKNGVDQQVAAWAKANGKSLATLETNESQVRVLAELPPEQEIELLAGTLTQIREMSQVVGSMLAAYRKGDIAALERILGIGLDEFPALRERVLKDRHDKWLPQIEQMIADGRTHLIVVGLAHLVGPDSIIAMLRSRGLRVQGP
jgi:uncharacterized protein YbaP (TraB family)